MLDSNPAVPDGAPPSLPDAPPVERHVPEFSGRAGEFFGIWFVNLLLSVVTLGIYSAWAKVRTERYFYGSTRIAGSSFDYLASPIAILKGRLVAYAVVIALYLSARFTMGVYFGLLILVFALMPMLIVLGLRFRARNSAWRGLTFRFDRSAGSAYLPFMGWPLLSMISLSLLYPVAKKRQHDFVSGGHRFGRKPFSFHGGTEAYYAPYLVALGLSIVIGGVFMALIFSMVGDASRTGAPPEAGGFAGLAAIMLLYAGLFVQMVFLQVRYGNLFWNNTRLGEHRFESTLRVRDMLWIYASNLVAIVSTVGLAVPWAMIRLANYRAAHFAVLSHGSIEDFVAEAEGQHAATGAEMVDALDMGVDFGV